MVFFGGRRVQRAAHIAHFDIRSRVLGGLQLWPAMEVQQLEHVGRHMRALRAAYEREQQERSLLEKKYARLKRRFLRLERAHAKLLVETQAVRSPAQRHRCSRATPLCFA